MINLLPPKAKRSILIEYWVRVISVWMIIVSVVLLAGAALLFPVYVYVHAHVAAKESAVTEASEKVNSFEDVSAALEQSSQLAKYALQESTLSSISEYVTLFESLQGSSIDIDSIEIQRAGRDVMPIKIFGVARDRKVLAEFRDKLLLQDDITEVDLPISNLASDKNIKFTITIKLSNDISL
jgi:hypothetical protein